MVLAHQMAMESTWVQADCVEAMEFPELAARFGLAEAVTINGFIALAAAGIYQQTV